MFISKDRPKSVIRQILMAYLLIASLNIASAQLASDTVKPDATSERPTGTQSKPDLTEEHWDKLQLGPNDLTASRPISGEKAAFPSYTREFLQVEWRGGDPIELYVIRPTGVKNPPVVLYLYGYPTDSDRFRSDELCKNLTKNGFAAVGFTSALTGQRYRDRPMKEWFVSELQESIGTSVHDVQMILNYLSTRGDLDMNRVGMFGQGSGGAIAILSAAVDPRIKAVDVLDPWGDWPDWLAKSPQIPERERSDYLTPAFLAKVTPLDPVLWLPKLNDRAIRVQELLFDPTSLEPVRKKVQAALPANATSVEYKTKDEYIEKVSKNARMLDWIQARLGTLPPNEPAPTVAKDSGAKTETAKIATDGATTVKPKDSQP